MNKNPHAHGAALAVKMLHELEEDTESGDTCGIDPKYRQKPQRLILLEFLDQLEGRAAMEGFCSILSDYIAGAACGAIPYAHTYKAEGDHA